MALFDRLQQTLQYIWGGVQRIFSPNQDEYPETGVQPFEGEPAEDKDR